MGLVVEHLQEIRDKRALESGVQSEAVALRTEDMMTLETPLRLHFWWLGFRERFRNAIQLGKAATSTHDRKLSQGALVGAELEATKLVCKAFFYVKEDPDRACALLARVIELGDTCDAPERWFARIAIASTLNQQGRAQEAARAYDELAHSARKAGLCKLAAMGLAGVHRCARVGEARCSAGQPSCPSRDKSAENRRCVPASHRSTRSSRARSARRAR